MYSAFKSPRIQRALGPTILLVGAILIAFKAVCRCVGDGTYHSASGFPGAVIDIVFFGILTAWGLAAVLLGFREYVRTVLRAERRANALRDGWEFNRRHRNYISSLLTYGSTALPSAAYPCCELAEEAYSYSRKKPQRDKAQIYTEPMCSRCPLSRFFLMRLDHTMPLCTKLCGRTTAPTVEQLVAAMQEAEQHELDSVRFDAHMRR